MWVRDDHQGPRPLSHDRPCASCGHDAHLLRCGADLADDVTCPCRCPVPGLP